MNTNVIDFNELKKVLPVSWVPGNLKTIEKKPHRVYHPYVEDVDIMDLLDEVCGIENWAMDVKEINGSTYCGIGIYASHGWVFRWDTGKEKKDGYKGDITTSMFTDGYKRAAMRFGIGRFTKRMDDVYLEWVAEKKCPIVDGRWMANDKVSDYINSMREMKVVGKSLPGIEINIMPPVNKKDIQKLKKYILALSGNNNAFARANLLKFTKRLGMDGYMTIESMKPADLALLWEYLKDTIYESDERLVA